MAASTFLHGRGGRLDPFPRIALAMAALLNSKDGVSFIGTIERFMEGWRASFRLRRPTEVFTEHGAAEFFSSEIQATKWLHTQATARGFSSIELRRHS